jgi:hypothetical protein
MKVVIFWRACLVTSLCVLAGCFQWTEDSQGKLQSAGLPGIPLWQSKAPPAPINPTEFGFTREEASKMSGAVLVRPTTNSGMMRYKYCLKQEGKLDQASGKIKQATEKVVNKVRDAVKGD